jgi:hypothetical protein
MYGFGQRDCSSAARQRKPVADPLYHCHQQRNVGDAFMALFDYAVGIEVFQAKLELVGIKLLGPTADGAILGISGDRRGDRHLSDAGVRLRSNDGCGLTARHPYA